MLKSVFSKYLLTFILIIVISFLVLAGLFCSLVTSYSADSKRAAVEDGADAVASFLEDSYRGSYSGSFSQYVYLNRDVLRGSLELLSVNEEQLLVLVSDEVGAVLLTDDGNERFLSSVVPEDFFSAVLSAGDAPLTQLTDLGMLDTGYLVSARTLQDDGGDVLGCVFVCSSSGSITGLVETMLKIMLVSCMWIMIAAMIAVYFISEKISSPLREMSRAAKQYAAGKFDVRVPVKGSDEVAELALAFNNMANSLATVEDQRRSFLANVSPADTDDDDCRLHRRHYRRRDSSGEAAVLSGADRGRGAQTVKTCRVASGYFQNSGRRPEVHNDRV